MDIFPQRLGPFAMVRAPFEAEDFLIPQLTKDIRAGFYWEMKTGILESHGLRARTSRITGQVSPLHPVQCDAACREGACVPPEAEDFAWSYPVVDWERVESDAYALEDWDSLEASAAMKSFLTVGGFIYFDAAGRIVGTTTPGKPRGGDGDGLHFGAPQRWRHEWTLPLAEQGRFQPVTMRQIVGVGARSFCWLRPDEVIEDGDGQPLPVQPQVPHGGLVYLFREDVMAGEEWDRALDRYFPVAAACDEGCATLAPAASDGDTLSLFRAFSLVEECPNVDPEWAGAGPEPFAEETDQDFDCEIPEECEVPRELSTPALHHRCPEFHASLVRARQASLAVERQRSGEAFEAP
uniref:Uncharacterized protein n=1 Tax=Pyrodinium bahamense TaxID=73915 RepID=A0A7S0A3W9_9DINO|mmetsp:Transcript_21212/g.58827  ORF Transcript_21212/g.58827 Transcript_21212/m.58827 type:complete len:351 (+) Transcript_21212:1-1053(+)